MVYTTKAWSPAALRLGRPLDTVHLDEVVKADLVADIVKYLQPETRDYYTERGNWQEFAVFCPCHPLQAPAPSLDHEPRRQDKPLKRPGRIDKTVLLSHSGPQAAGDLFMSMYKPRHHGDDVAAISPGILQGVQDQADAFAAQIPEDTFTPAKLQSYLLAHRDSPTEALSQVGGQWVREEREETARLRTLEDKYNAKNKEKEEDKEE